jgi:zinc resistance-associated protein
MTKGSLEAISDLLYSSQQTGQIPRAPQSVTRICNDQHGVRQWKPGLTVALTMTAIISSAIALATLSGRADPAAFPSPTQKHEFSDADRAAFLDARIAALHAGLKLSPEQEKLWPAVETALRTAGKSAMDRYQKFKNEPADRNLIDRIRQRGENAVARGQNIEAIADAAPPLYATLNEEQKHRLPVLMHGLGPHFFHHHFAMMGHDRENWRGHWDEHGGIEPEGGGQPGQDVR